MHDKANASHNYPPDTPAKQAPRMLQRPITAISHAAVEAEKPRAVTYAGTHT